MLISFSLFYLGLIPAQALPTFGVIPQFGSSSSMPMDFVPNFDPTKLLHGEQYLKILAPIPTSGTVVNEVQLLEVLDKGKAASVTVKVVTTDKVTGKSIFENQSTVFLRGCGGFGGQKRGSGESTLCCWVHFITSRRHPLVLLFLARGS